MTARLTVISGPMFSGKTEELIRLIARAKLAGRQVQVFKPMIENRLGRIYQISSHTGIELEAQPIQHSLDILTHLKSTTQVVAVDEVQFFDSQIVDAITEIIEQDVEVITAGLPLDFRGEPFGQMPILLALADKIIVLTAVCTYTENGKVCGKEATRSQRLLNGKPAHYSEPTVLIGAEESYAPRCPDHHQVPGKSLNAKRQKSSTSFEGDLGEWVDKE